MVYAVVNVLNLFTELVTDDSFANQSGTEQLAFLYESYLIFWEFGSNFDALMNMDSAIIQYTQFLYLGDESYEGVLRNNV